ncbi:MAG: retropepsin-like domain-containing protein [Dehalococcoidia bacterium]|nr:retropepsin-like domain-containing protein [Dehalococcoidia bacterium]
MRIRINRGSPITFFVRVKGPRAGRELRALLDTGSSLCTIPATDAREIGYAAFYDPIVDKGDGIYTLTQSGIMDLGGLTLEEVVVAELSAKAVPAVVCQLPRMGGIDMVLGLSFMSRFKTTLDYESGWLTMEQIRDDDV